MRIEQNNNSEYNQDESILNEHFFREVIFPRAYLTTPAEYCANFQIQKEGLLIDIFSSRNPGNIQNWVEVSGSPNSDFDWHGLQEDWLALLKGFHRVEVIELPKIDLKSVYQNVRHLKLSGKPITLKSLQATNYRSYEEIKKAGLTRVIELSAPEELNAKNIPILVIPQGVFHAALSPNPCLMLNIGKKIGVSSEYSKLDYETYAR